jgi:hypothetical protein
MVDPTDNVTKPLPQPARLRFASNGRIYSAILTQDLLEDWTVIQSWGGKYNQRGGGQITHVPTFEAGVAMLHAIAIRREKHGYQVL